MEHTKFMKIALAQAQKSARLDEVPVGAVVVGPDGKIISRAHNLTEARNTQAAHAEVLAISKAGKKLGDWRLNGCWLYGFTQLDSVKQGPLYKDRRSPLVVIEGVGAQESAILLKEFFKKKRLAS